MSGINQDDFDRIFTSLYGPIRNFIYYKCGDIYLAEDVAQDVFVKIWEKKADIKKETVKQFCYTIANNLFLNKVERQKISFKFINTCKPENLVEAADFNLEMNEFDRKLQLALAGLDEKKRAAFLMNRIEGMTYKEIAEATGVTVKAVEKRMEKALTFIKKRIEMTI